MQRRVTVLSAVVALGVPALLLGSGGSAVMRDVASALTGGSSASAGTVALYVLAFVLIVEVVRMPVAFYGGFLLERQYGLSAVSARTWVADQVRAVGVALVLAQASAGVVYAALRLWPDWWWLASALAFAAGLALLARVAPTLLLPLFYRFTPLDRAQLRERLVLLSRRAGVPVLGAFEWALGEKTRRANAALVGTGATRRILVSDTLLDAYSDDEIEVILAHELAHHVHRDIAKGLLLESTLIAVAFYAAASALGAWWPALALQGKADVAGLPLLALCGTAVMLGATPLVNALSRVNERRADLYALRLTGQPSAFITAMRRLAAQNLAEERPSRLAQWLFHSHPPIEERIAMARRFQ